MWTFMDKHSISKPLTSLIDTKTMYKVVTLTTVMLLLLLPGTRGQETMELTAAMCEQACDAGYFYEGCKCFRQVFRWGKRSGLPAKKYSRYEEENSLPSKRSQDVQLSRAQVKKVLYELLAHLR